MKPSARSYGYIYARVGVLSLHIVHGCMLLYYCFTTWQEVHSTYVKDTRRIFWRLAEFVIITIIIFVILPKTRV